MWLPYEKIVATGDIVTAPIPLMPSAYTGEYVNVLNKLKALDFKLLVPGHGLVEHDAQYVDLLIDTIGSVSSQMKALIANGLSKEDAVSKMDYSAIEKRFTNGVAFLKNRFQDTASALSQAAYLVESGAGARETF